jgi:hypothetical protein
VVRESECVSADGESSGGHQAITLLAMKVLLHDQWRNGESTDKLNGDPVGVLVVTRVRGDTRWRVQDGVRWQGRHSVVAPREVSRSRHHHLGPGRNVPLKRQRLAIGNNGGGCGKAMERVVTNYIDSESGNDSKTLR